MISKSSKHNFEVNHTVVLDWLSMVTVIRMPDSNMPLLRSVWLVIGFGKSWALLRVFGLRR